MRRSTLWLTLILVSASLIACAEGTTATFSGVDLGDDGGDAVDVTAQPDTGPREDTAPPRDTGEEPFCGDGVVQADLGERCDSGTGNSDSTPDACRTDCSEARCGDNVIDSGENCDNGADNVDGVPRACPTSCMSEGPVCGDAVIDDGEECDSGSDNSDTNPDACRRDCTSAFCGDGVIDTDERCDDGDAIDDNGCSNACNPVLDALCASCQSDSECGRPVDRCLGLEGGGFCTVSCELGTTTCPIGYECSDAFDDPQCIPVAGSCVEVCTNGGDDDGDGLADCADPDCDSDAMCGSEVCDDGFDNDGDGALDCDDAGDCSTAPACQDPCASPSACNSPPADACQDASVLITYPPMCTDNGGVAQCDYPPTPDDCSNSGNVCDNGACVPPCAAASATCDQIPPAACQDQDTRVFYDSMCSNSGGMALCSYPETTEDCDPSQVCLDGQCVFPSAIPRPDQAGDLIITEYMINPDHQTDNDFEWIELYNGTSSAFNLEGCMVRRNNDAQRFPINPTAGTAVAFPGEYFLLGTSTNYGLDPDYLYSASSFLIGGFTNSASDTLRIECGNPLTLIDEVNYNFGTTPPEGRAWSLHDSTSRDHISNDNLANWCLTEAGVYYSDAGGSERGTPDAQNEPCP